MIARLDDRGPLTTVIKTAGGAKLVMEITGSDPTGGESIDHGEIGALRAIVEGTAQGTGAAFFESLVRHLAEAIGVSYAFVAEFAGSRDRVRTMAYWGRGRILENTEFDLAGTPCEDVVRGGLCHHPRGVREKFPRDQDAIDLGIESYLGVPLLDGDGLVLGHLAVFDERPMPDEPRRLFIFRIFATRAAVELERLRVEKQLVESERRYRELYEEAPNAYVAIGIDRRLLSVNHRATQLLGMPASGAGGSAPTRFVRRDGRRTAPRRGGPRRGLRRRGGLRPGAGDAPSGWRADLDQPVDEAAPRRRRANPRRALDLGRYHRPDAAPRANAPASSSRTSTSRRRSSPSTTSRRSSAVAPR